VRHADPLCVQRLPPNPSDRLLQTFVRNAAPLRAGIERIADDRVSDVLHVHAYLMRAAGADAAAEEGDVAERLDDFIVGDRAAAAGNDRHAPAGARVASDPRVARSLRRLRASGDAGAVLLPHRIR